jgi:hypothetical protein
MPVRWHSLGRLSGTLDGGDVEDIQHFVGVVGSGDNENATAWGEHREIGMGHVHSFAVRSSDAKRFGILHCLAECFCRHEAQDSMACFESKQTFNGQKAKAALHEPVSLLSTLQGKRSREHAKAWTTNAARFMGGEHGAEAKAATHEACLRSGVSAERR